MSLNKVKELREGIILRGKHSKEYVVVANGRTDNKYTNLDDTLDAGSIRPEDCDILYDLVVKYKPKVIFEIGTWFGVSAMTMAIAMEDLGIDGIIHTCDSNKLCSYSHPFIKSYRDSSTRALKILKKKGVKLDMAFIDGRFYPGDEKRIMRMASKKFLFAVHDYEGNKKGARCMIAMKDYLTNPIVKTETTIAYTEIV